MDQHKIAHVLPHLHDNDRHQCPFGRRKPAGQQFCRNTDHAQKLVDRAAVFQEHGLEHGTDSNDGGNIGEENRRAEEVDELDFSIQQQRKTQRRDHAENDRKDAEHDGLPQRCTEHTILEDIDKVLQPHKLHGGKAVPLHHTEDEGEDNGHQNKDCKTNKVGQDKGKADQRIAGIQRNETLFFGFSSS